MPIRLLIATLALAACKDKAPPDPGEEVESRLEVSVVDDDGQSIAGAVVMMGGWSEDRWLQTGEDGRAWPTLVDEGWTEQYLLAGKQGFTSGGVRLDFDDLPELLEIEMAALPTEDNPGYHFQPGGDGSSPDTSECGHCHWSIGDDWASSAHGAAANSAAVWDVYTGSARALSETDCDGISGWLEDGLVAGTEADTAAHCYTGEGVLPWLHADCGSAGQPSCDHPEQRDTLTSFGSCADCHAPAIDGGVPGSLDLARATGVGFEGVTCDFCHKIQSVEPGVRPGLDGAITLLRPSEDTFLPNQQHRPITFGPYPDVIVPIMNGVYTPQFKEAEWCSSCHEYAQQPLHPDQEIARPELWPDGIPVFETWSEFTGSAFVDSYSCQGCHMPALAEESSTYDITPLGLEPSVDQGWMRESGEVRHHGFSRAGLGDPSLSIALSEVDGELEVIAEVKNGAAAHAVPTGEPMKQIVVRVQALDADDNPVAAIGGQAVPDVGGYRATGTIGEGAEVVGQVLTLSGAAVVDTPGLVVRFTRPTESWDDYAGPGTAPFSDGEWSAEEKGMEIEAVVAELAVGAVDTDSLTLVGELPELEAGDRVYVAASDDHAGAAGWLFAKVLLDAEGNRGVPHYRALDVASDNRIGPGSSATSVHRFPLSAGVVTIEATLIRRDRAATVADLYGWSTDDVLITTVTEPTLR